MFERSLFFSGQWPRCVLLVFAHTFFFRSSASELYDCCPTYQCMVTPEFSSE